MKTMFTHTVFEILLFEVRLVLGLAQRVPGSEKVTRLRGFEWFLIFFILLNLFRTGEMEKLDF